MAAEGLQTPKGITLLQCLRALISHALPDISLQEVMDILDARAIVAPALSQEDVPADLLEEALGAEEAAKIQDRPGKRVA